MQSLLLTNRAEQFGRHAAALLGFSIPISVALDNTLLVLVAVLWLAGGGLRQKIGVIGANTVALSALALFGMLAAGLAYGTRNSGDGLVYFGKYVDLLFVPIFITLFQDTRVREIALRWFCAAMVLTFVVAEITMLGLLDGNALLPRSPGSMGAFKYSITHGLLAAFAAFVFALLAQREDRLPYRVLFVALALVAVKNVLFVSVSRTAYIVLVLLSLYFFFVSFRRRNFWIGVLLLAASLAAAYMSSPVLKERVDKVASEISDWRADGPTESSVGLRLEWYRMSLSVVQDHPLLGTGTGSPPKIYAERTGGPQARATANPHNEYLLITVQTGLAGLALLLHLFWQQVRLSARLASPVEVHLARGLLIMIAVGCLFNSLLLDHTEGLFYAWFTGLLYGGLKSQPPQGGDRAQ